MYDKNNPMREMIVKIANIKIAFDLIHVLYFGFFCLTLFTCFYRFLNLPLTTEAMRILRFAGAFAVVKRQSECGSKTAGMHVSQPMDIGVC